MQIKMLTRSAGPNGNRSIGQVLVIGVDITQEEANSLLSGNYAETVGEPSIGVSSAEEPETVETATVKPVAEKATKQRKNSTKGN